MAGQQSWFCRLQAWTGSQTEPESSRYGGQPAPSPGEQRRYTSADVALWRADFGFSRRQHSLASFGYTDEELIEWRRQFDELAEEERISFPVFERLVSDRFKGVVPETSLQEKARQFWVKFDQDGNTVLDFGEFVAAGLLFDVQAAKERIRVQGIEATFLQYGEDGFMAEAHFIQLMSDFGFFAITATDVQKLMQAADQDGDGLVSLSDFIQWVESADVAYESKPMSRRTRARKAPPPPPEPEG